MNDPVSERFQCGLIVRRSVMGDDYVDKALVASNDFDWPMQALSTEYCWDEIWNRPGLDRRSRSLLNLGMLSALNRPTELRGHIRGALNNGLTKNELREIFLQVAVYCGIPVGLDCFRIAQEVLKEEGI